MNFVEFIEGVARIAERLNMLSDVSLPTKMR